MGFIVLIMFIISLASGAVMFLTTFRKDRAKASIALAMCIFVPVVGIFLGIILLGRFRHGRYAIDTEETIRKIKIQESEYIDNERMMNTAPARDALSISGNRERRGFMRGLLRQYEMEALRPILHRAVHNPDSEASHYAASAIMELQRLSYGAMDEAAGDYEKDPDNYETAKRYALLILDYLDNSEIGSMELTVFRSRYENVMLHILRDMNDKCCEDDYEKLIRLYLRQNRRQEAWDWSNLYAKAYPKSEKSYFILIELSYMRMDFVAFNEALHALRTHNDIVLSHEGLTSLRFWINQQSGGGVAN